MIQEIFPHRFHNEFYIKTPAGDSVFFYIRHDSILLDCSGELKLPTLSQLQSEPAFHAAEQAASGSFIYLFSIDSTDYFLIDETRIILSENQSLALKPLKAIRELQPLETAFAAANGTQLHRFYKTNRFCGACGTPTEKKQKERATICPSCDLTNYPKLAPAIIVAVTDQNRLLLIKYAGKNCMRYALVAGYTEFGETLEETVKREVMEEVGLKVKNIRYYKSQPWAYSDSLLAGFFAELDGSPQIRLDKNELSTAKWEKREDISDDYTNFSLTHEMILLFKRNGEPK